jgi:hypothetical protein
MRYLFLILFFVASSVQAETYMWTDGAGTVHFTESLGEIPAQYRNNAKSLGIDTIRSTDDGAENRIVTTPEEPGKDIPRKPADLAKPPVARATVKRVVKGDNPWEKEGMSEARYRILRECPHLQFTLTGRSWISQTPKKRDPNLKVHRIIDKNCDGVEVPFEQGLTERGEERDDFYDEFCSSLRNVNRRTSLQNLNKVVEQLKRRNAHVKEIRQFLCVSHVDDEKIDKLLGPRDETGAEVKSDGLDPNNPALPSNRKKPVKYNPDLIE